MIILCDYLSKLHQSICDVFKSLKLDCKIEICLSKWHNDPDCIDFYVSYGGVSIHQLGYVCTLDVSEDTYRIAKHIVYQLLEYHSEIVIRLDDAFAILNGEETKCNPVTHKMPS